MPCLSPANIEHHWYRLVPCLRTVQAKAPAEWTIPEVYQACRDSEAFLFLAPEGFCILRPLADGHPTVQVWIAYAEGGGNLTRYEPEIERLAREIGATRLIFSSPRLGYRRALRHWQRQGNDYERYLI